MAKNREMTEREPMKSLADIYPGWTTSLMESAHSSIKQGVADIRARANGARFLLIVTEESMSYDDYDFWIRALEPFPALKQAESYATNWVKRAIPRMIEEESRNSMPWHHVIEKDNLIRSHPGTKTGHAQKGLTPKRVLGFTIQGHPTYFWRRVRLDILAVQLKDVVDAGIFDYVKAHSAWWSFLEGRTAYPDW